MTFKEFKEYMNKNGFEYDHNKKAFIKEYNMKGLPVFIEYHMKRDVILMKYRDRVGKTHKSLKGRLRNLSITSDGQIVGFKKYEPKRRKRNLETTTA